MQHPNPLAQLPSVDLLLGHPDLVSRTQELGRSPVVACIRDVLADARQTLITAQQSEQGVLALPLLDDLVAAIDDRLTELSTASLTAVINLTGTVLHTNLGRALLPEAAIEAIALAARTTTNLEFDLKTGKRGDRDKHIESLICELTGAEAATVVNNNAAAVMLTLNTLAMGQEVPVSRGELVEIGGSFRVPDIMSRSGCRLVEIGTTNRTHAKDYRNAINGNTALLMKVHTSNYVIEGFSKSVSDAEVATLAHEYNLPMVTDLGSGALVDLAQFNLPAEPTVASMISGGADVVTFSGDKLLGGPQAGIIAGSSAQIAKIKANPMKRALRVDKLTIAALFEVLKLYRNPDRVVELLPTIRLLHYPSDIINRRAQDLLAPLERALKDFARVHIEACASQIGSGSLPVDKLPSYALVITPLDRSDGALQDLVSAFRQLPVPVIGRVSNGTLRLDMRCMEDTSVFLQQLPRLIPASDIK